MRGVVSCEGWSRLVSCEGWSHVRVVSYEGWSLMHSACEVVYMILMCTWEYIYMYIHVHTCTCMYMYVSELEADPGFRERVWLAVELELLNFACEICGSSEAE